MSDIQSYGLEARFSENAVFYKDVTIHGKLNYDFERELKTLKLDNLTVQNLEVLGIASFYGPVYFYDDVFFSKGISVNGDIDAGIITARKRLDVGVGGTTLRADASTGNVGIGSTVPQKELDVDGTAIVSQRVGIGTTEPQQELDVVGTATISERIGIGSVAPQQRVDVAGSVKIDVTIYDSVNVPGKNGYQMVRDQVGLRWIPLIADPVPGITTLGIPTDGMFILDEGVPLYPS